MAYFFLGIVLLAVLVLLARWAAHADPSRLARAVRVVGVVVLLAVSAFVLLTGRLQWAVYLLPFLLPFYFQWRSNRIRARNAAGPSPGGASEVDTGWLRMTLDHDSGEMQGVVQRGRFAGRGLEGMSLEELVELRDELGADGDSLRVLDAYLDRVHGPAWRGGRGAGQARDGAMTEAEALEVLGLAPGATVEEIKEAHRRLMARMHPDRGGSTYLAAKLNQAKDYLLKRR